MSCTTSSRGFGGVIRARRRQRVEKVGDTEQPSEQRDFAAAQTLRIP